MKIRLSEARDLGAVARCHIDAFPMALASMQGPSFVRRMLSWHIDSNRAFLLHAVSETNETVGYCSAIIRTARDQTGAASSIIRHSKREAIWSYVKRPWLIFHPGTLGKITLLLKRIRRDSAKAKKTNNLEEKKMEPFEVNCGIVGIGVRKSHRGTGVADALIKEFERIAKNNGAKFVTLTVDASNPRAIHFYERNNWCQTKKDGRSVSMRKSL